MRSRPEINPHYGAATTFSFASRVFLALSRATTGVLRGREHCHHGIGERF
jgi:hypothetical protein